MVILVYTFQFFKEIRKNRLVETDKKFPTDNNSVQPSASDFQNFGYVYVKIHCLKLIGKIFVKATQSSPSTYLTQYMQMWKLRQQYETDKLRLMNEF